MPLTFKDNITQFMEMWLQWTHNGVRPPADALDFVGPNSCVTLFRDGAFQVQLFTCQPNTEIPDHGHPNMRGYAMYLSGDVYFRRNGTYTITPELVAETEAKGKTLLGLIGRLDPGDTHGATIGPRGGAFIGIQEWINDVAPKSVHLDWTGEPVDADHAKQLEAT